MSEHDEILSPRALVAHRQINSEVGGTTVFCVVLADGFIIECGSDGYSQHRAKLLAEIINATNPAAFNFRRVREGGEADG